MKKPTIKELHEGMRRFRVGDRPWPEREVDWYVASEGGKLYPLKYTYALTVDARPSTFTTNQAKRAMRHLELGYVSLRENSAVDDSFEASVNKSITDKDGRKERLQNSDGMPDQYAVVQQVFSRNPDVVAEVLERAGGKCESCGSPAPFNKRSNGAPYLEVHHKQQLAHGGKDVVSNAVALCPNCHRKAHYG